MSMQGCMEKWAGGSVGGLWALKILHDP